MNAFFGLMFLAQVAQSGAVPPGATTPPADAAASAVVQTAPAGASAAAPAAASSGPLDAAAPQGQMWQTLIFFGVMILVFWLLIIRPQQKQRKKQEAFLTSLKSGDKVILASGFIGRIVNMSGDVVTVELDKDVRVRVVKSQIGSHFKDEGEAKA
jgi:preprotein translocase subunit YajC